VEGARPVDPAGYYNWPDVFRLLIDTAPRRRSSRSGWGAKVSPTS
jgi:hypothetical protein